ncbi:MAG: PQQ-binding-like beta-propeller repeat protein, partial [Planctomycetota bacterium]|nr:PQQ-binding-like beta-propeller repeat protein [Planctomycetota bacterium]
GRARRIRRRGNPWDSPLILFGGGGLVLLMVTGVALFLFLSRGSGDDLLHVADADYNAARYANAGQSYETFVTKYPRHPKISHARVWRGLTQIRRQRESPSDWSKSLDLVTNPLSELQSEAAFVDARPELAGLLPDLAGGIVEEALRQDSLENKSLLVEQAKRAIELIDNSGYIPSSQRKNIEGRVEAIRDNLQVAERDVQRGAELSKTLQNMQSSMVSKNPVAAYEARERLLRQYPALQTDESLSKNTQEIATAEVALIRAETDPVSATQDDIPTIAERKLIFTRQSVSSPTDGAQKVHLLRLQGHVYAFNVTNGKLLWRRFLGLRCDTGPWQFPSSGVLWHADEHCLLAVDLLTGKLKWRLPVPDGNLYATQDGQQLIVTSDTGKLFLIDVELGTVSRTASFPRGLSAATCRIPKTNFVLQPAEHSTVYLLDGQTLEGRGNFFLGHSAGTLTVPPFVLGENVLIGVHSQSNHTDLHVLHSGDEPGQLRPRQEPLRIAGRISQPMQAFDRRRLFLITDRGVLAVVGTAGEDSGNNVQVLASTVPNTDVVSRQTYATLFANQLFVGDEQLARLEVLTARGQIVPREFMNQGASYLTPLQTVGDVLIQVYRGPGRSGAQISAWRGTADRPLQQVWETEFAVPRAGALIADATRRRLLSVSANGAVHQVDGEVMRTGTSHQPLQQLDLHPTAGALHQVRGTSPRDAARLLFVSDGPIANVFRINLEDEQTPLRRQELAQVRGQVGAMPIPFGGGILLATRQGPITLTNMDDGRRLATPFQPPQELASDFRWLDPVTIADDTFCIADTTGKMYLIQLSDGRLNLVKQSDLAMTLQRGMIGNSKRLWMSGDQGKSVLVQVDPLGGTKQGEVELPGPLDWGPHLVADRVWVSSDGTTLSSVSEGPTLNWSVQLEDGPLVGQPLVRGDQAIVMTMSGVALSFDANSGSITDRLKLHEPVAGGCIPFQERLIVPGLDGTLHVLPVWPKQER